MRERFVNRIAVYYYFVKHGSILLYPTTVVDCMILLYGIRSYG